MKFACKTILVAKVMETTVLNEFFTTSGNKFLIRKTVARDIATDLSRRSIKNWILHRTLIIHFSRVRRGA